MLVLQSQCTNPDRTVFCLNLFLFRQQGKAQDILFNVSQTMEGPSLTFLSQLEQEAIFIPKPWPLASQSLGEFTSHCLPTMHRGPDVMSVSWVAKHSHTHHAPRETIRESSSVTAARKCCTALNSLAARSQRASCWKKEVWVHNEEFLWFLGQKGTQYVKLKWEECSTKEGRSLGSAFVVSIRSVFTSLSVSWTIIRDSSLCLYRCELIKHMIMTTRHKAKSNKLFMEVPFQLGCNASSVVSFKIKAVWSSLCYQLNIQQTTHSTI